MGAEAELITNTFAGGKKGIRPPAADAHSVP
jgi:hypothetical protein